SVLALTLTVRASGVVQQSTPDLLTVSQAPPLLVTATESKLKLDPVLIAEITWGSGLAPPNGMVKLMGLIWRKTLAPTVTATGMVTLLPVVWKESWPTNVPAISPPPGRLLGVMLTDTVVGVVPLRGVAASQSPPSEVLKLPVQLKLPVPPLRTWSVCAGTVGAPVSSEKLISPAMLSKYLLEVGAMVRVTGTIIARS